jgi:hypothetical protein
MMLVRLYICKVEIANAFPASAEIIDHHEKPSREELHTG